MVCKGGLYIGRFVKSQDLIGRGFEINMNQKVQLNILWDFIIQCDHMIETRRPDIVVVNKVKKYNDYKRGNTMSYKNM